ncbi:MAG: methyltransferase domain-containing protein [Planctomycetes bacterium]|nr:methyltransferase domain-containing protein [Planctomycetota bacterium]
MSLLADLRTMKAMVRGRGDEAAPLKDRLERFYADQAEDYDRFRERMLHGRDELIALLPSPPGARLVEFGGGTGRNLERFGSRLNRFADVELVDLCPSLLSVARRRCARLGWSNVRCVEADVTAYQASSPVDVLYCSYSLSMVPDWRRAIDAALAALAPGGVLGVVDFFVSEADPPPGRARHSAWSRWFWPRWFAHDGVAVHSEHLAYLASRTIRLSLWEGTGPLPYLCARVPYYVYVGRKPPV